MVKKKKPKISDAIAALNSQPLENPFGIIEDVPYVRGKKKPSQSVINLRNAIRFNLLKHQEEMVSTYDGQLITKAEALRQSKLEAGMFDEEDAIQRRVKRLMTTKGYSQEKALRIAIKKHEKSREVIMFPEKSNCESPKKSKLNKPSKEIEKMQHALSNIVRVPKEQLDTFMDVYNSSSSKISSEFLASIAPVLLAYDDAMSYSTVALRDGLSFDGEIDLELAPLLEWSARLNAFELYLSALTSLSDETKARILRLATTRAVEKAFNTKPSGGGLTGSAGNKVAGIVTSQSPENRDKIKNALNAVSKLNNVSKMARSQKPKPNITTPLAGVVAQKRFRGFKT